METGPTSILDLPKDVLWLILRRVIRERHLSVSSSFMARYTAIHADWYSSAQFGSFSVVSEILRDLRLVCIVFRNLIRSKCIQTSCNCYSFVGVMGSFLYLHSDILHNVLFPKLDVVSLVRLSCTCKHWNYSLAVQKIIDFKVNHYLKKRSHIVKTAFECLYIPLVGQTHPFDLTEVFAKNRQLYPWVLGYYISLRYTQDIYNYDGRMRFFRNVMRMFADPLPFLDLKLIRGIHILEVCFQSPENSPFGKVRYVIRLSKRHPFTAPEIVCHSHIFHPGYFDGLMCLDILNDNWSPVLSLESLMISISSLLSWPNGVEECMHDAADVDAASLFKKDRNLFFAKALEVARLNEK